MRMTFAERLREVRKSKGITAKEFAKSLGLKYETYIGYETKGTEPKQETLIKIAAAIGVSIDELLGYIAEEADDTNLWRRLQDIFRLLNSGKAHWHGKKFDKRDIEELNFLVETVHRRAKDMAYREEVADE